MSNIVLNNNLKMRVGRHVDLITVAIKSGGLAWATLEELFLSNPAKRIYTFIFGKYATSPFQTIREVYTTNPQPEYLTAPISRNETLLIPKVTGLVSKFNRKEIRFFDSGGSELAFYTHKFPLTDIDSVPIAAGSFSSNGTYPVTLHSHVFFHNDNHMYTDPTDGNLIFTLIPAISIPVHDHVVNKRVTRFEVKVFNVHDKLTMKVDGTVSTPTGSGDIKLSSNFVTQGSSILVNGLDKFKIVVPNELPLNLISEEVVV